MMNVADKARRRRPDRKERTVVVMSDMKMRSLSGRILGGMMCVAMVASVSWGRLGESPDKCDQRYGLDFIQKGPEEFWAFSREYTKNDIKVVVRFIDVVGRGKVAGWIAYTPAYTLKERDALRQKIRETVSGSWEDVVEQKIVADMPPTVAEQTKVRNKYIAETRATIASVTGWSYGSCWTTPAAYAADNGITLVMFSNTYFAQFEYWQTQKQKAKDSQKETSVPAGF